MPPPLRLTAWLRAVPQELAEDSSQRLVGCEATRYLVGGLGECQYEVVLLLRSGDASHEPRFSGRPAPGRWHIGWAAQAHADFERPVSWLFFVPDAVLAVIGSGVCEAYWCELADDLPHEPLVHPDDPTQVRIAVLGEVDDAGCCVADTLAAVHAQHGLHYRLVSHGACHPAYELLRFVEEAEGNAEVGLAGGAE